MAPVADPGANGAPAGTRPPCVAALDVGTNSIRLIVAEVSEDGSYRVVDDEKIIARLGHGLAATGRMNPERIEAAVEAIVQLKGIAEGFGVVRLDAVATAAVREAANGEELVRLLDERAGVHLRVISAEEEARLAYRSVDNAYNLEALNALIVDVGGGSTEIVHTVGGVIQSVHSLPLGAVRLTEIYGRCEGDETEYRRLRRHVRDVLNHSVQKPDSPPQIVFGTGGTFTALANISMHRASPDPSSGDILPFTVRGYEMQRSEVRHILDWLRKMTTRQRAGISGLSPDRAEIIVAGVTIADRLMQRYAVNRLQTHDGGIRDGLLLTVIDDIRGVPPEETGREPVNRLRDVRRFASKCNFEARDSEHVAALSVSLFDQLSRVLPEPDQLVFAPENRDLVEAAAILRDVGYLINYAKHHKHSYHLIMHSDVRGFTQRERSLVANVARYHRRALPKPGHPGFAKLSERDRSTVRGLAAILRVADGLDRAHTQSVRGVRVGVDGRRAVFDVYADAEPAVDIWGAERKSRLFQNTFGLEPVFRWAGPAPAGSETPEARGVLGVGVRGIAR